VQATLADLVPSKAAERVAWLERFGVVKDLGAVPVAMDADLAVWAQMEGWYYVRTDGTVGANINTSQRGLCDAGCCSENIGKLLEAYVVEHGKLPERIAVDDMLRAIIAEQAAKAAKKIADDLARQARLEAEAKADAEAKAAEAREVAAWITAQGSARLRRCHAEGIECAAIYRSERIALERPGWRYAQCVQGEYSDPRNPPDDVVAQIDAARVVAPDAKLAYWEADAETDEDGVEIAPKWAGYVMIAKFLGREIVLGGPA
jgi:hypothetical protein